jgi:hypothetical protein
MLKLRIFSPCGKSLSILLSFWPCVAALAGASPLWAQQAGGVATSAPQVRVVRSGNFIFDCRGHSAEGLERTSAIGRPGHARIFRTQLNF